MSAIAWTDVTALPGAARLASVDTGYQNVVLAMVNTRVSVAAFDGEDGPTTKLVRCYLAAHHAAMASQRAPGALTEQHAGGIGKSFATPTSTHEYATTSFGLLYLALVNTSTARLPRAV